MLQENTNFYMLKKSQVIIKGQITKKILFPVF